MRKQRGRPAGFLRLTSVLGRMRMKGGTPVPEIAGLAASGQKLWREARMSGTRAGAFGQRGGVMIPGNWQGHGALARRFHATYGRRLGRLDTGGAHYYNRRNLQVAWEIFYRQRAAKHTAIGWMALGKGGRLQLPDDVGGGTHEWSVRRMNGIAGSVGIRFWGGGNFRLEITNRTPGMAALDAKKGIVSRALANATADMSGYLAAHEARTAARLAGRRRWTPAN